MIFSHTFLVDFENCPRKAWHKFVARDLPKQKVMPEAMKWGIEVHEALAARLEHQTPLPANMPYEHLAGAVAKVAEGATLLTEKKLGMTTSAGQSGFFDNDVWFRGAVDVGIVNGNNAVIVDWKTGKKREDPYELEVFGLLLKIAYPGLQTVRGFYVWLKDKAAGKLHDLSNFAATWNSIKGRTNQIERLDPAKEWPPNENPLCGFCPVLTCEFNRTPR